MSTPSSYAEPELLELVASGNEPAFRELVHRYAGLLFTYIEKITDDSLIAEDLVQDTFLKIWLTRENLGKIQHFRAYLFAISRNLALKLINHKIREAGRLQEFKYYMTVQHPDEVLEEWKYNLLDEAIAQLPPQQQKVWLLSRKHNLKYREIADQLNLSRETVKKYLQYAKEGIAAYISRNLLTFFGVIFIFSQQ